jgi:hypothetical protein
MRLARNGTAPLVLACLALAAAGCSGSGTGARSASTTTTPSGATSSGQLAASTALTGTTTGQGTGAAAPAGLSRDAAAKQTKLRITLNELHRAGGLVTLNLTFTNLEPPDPAANPGYQVAGFFDDGDSNGFKGSVSLSLDSVDGIYLVDNANKKRYPVARDSTRRCVCSAHLEAVFIAPGESTILSATFGAPPADVQAVDVFVPHAGTFHDVPVR